jgi:hypothetical protein
VRAVTERLLREATTVAGSDGTGRSLSPIAITAAEGDVRGYVEF